MVYQDGFSDPRLIITDYSLALIMAFIKEFCKENLKTYINRTFKTLNGTASREDVKSTLIHICYSHMMRRNKINLSKLLE